MSTIWFTEEQAATVVNHAVAQAPNEACGLLLGEFLRVAEVVPAHNVALNPRHQYEIDPTLVSRHLPKIIGFYHSHPQTSPIPSQADIREAWPSDTVYVIVGIQRGQYQLTAWRFRRGEVESVEIYVGIEPPVQTPPLSQAQKAIIILSGVAAVILFLMISLSLLPPAPAIP